MDGWHLSIANTETETIAQTAPLLRIERMPEFEGAMNKLGYQARGYRWYGGIVDGTIRILWHAANDFWNGTIGCVDSHGAAFGYAGVRQRPGNRNLNGTVRQLQDSQPVWRT